VVLWWVWCRPVDNSSYKRSDKVAKKKMEGGEEVQVQQQPVSDDNNDTNKVDASSSGPPCEAEGIPPSSSLEQVTYPLSVIYCGNCGLPPEYCEYYPDFDACRKWLEANLPSEMGGLSIGAGGGGEEEKKGRQKRGGKGLVSSKKAGGGGGGKPKKICVSRAPRGKKKSVTVVTGLGTFGVDLKAAAKFFSTKFACSSSVTGEDEIVIQGDVKDDLFDVLPEKWPEVDLIEDLGDQKR